MTLFDYFVIYEDPSAILTNYYFFPRFDVEFAAVGVSD